MTAPGLLIADLDNTLYDFPAYYEAGIQATVDKLCTTFAVDATTGIGWLREVYTSHGSIEYPFAIEEVPPVRSLAKDARRAVVHEVLRAFWTSATARLELYPTVEQTLAAIYRQNVPIVAYTDAPIYEATRRLRQLGVSKYFAGVVARAWFRRRPMATFVHYLEDMPGFSRPARSLKIAWRLPDPDRKPSPDVYRRIAQAFEIPHANVTVIGDSIPRDLLPAAAIGMTTVWARYGARRPVDENLLQQVVPTRLPELLRPYELTASSVADTFEDVAEHLPVQQMLKIWRTSCGNVK